MELAFFVLTGPAKGRLFPIQPGVTVGRLEGDIALSDLKVSGKHARVERDNQGGLTLIDLGSTNGIKIDGQKVGSIKLNPGLRIQLGSSLLEVQIYTPETILKNSQEPLSNPKENSGRERGEGEIHAISKVKAQPQAVEEKKQLKWNEIAVEFLKSKKNKIKNRPKLLVPFSPPLILTFVRGLQFDTTWYLGYGPRTAGAESFDMPILETGAPGLCFEIWPTPQGPTFKTHHPNIVLLNNKPIANAHLKSGDMISIFDCQIKMGFDEKIQ
jgi:hypothetical protein